MPEVLNSAVFFLHVFGPMLRMLHLQLRFKCQVTTKLGAVLHVEDPIVLPDRIPDIV